MEYDFTLILAGAADVTDSAANRLFECGCDDGLFGATGGVGYVDFTRESTSMEKAISSAIADVKKAGFEVERIEVEPNQFVNV